MPADDVDTPDEDRAPTPEERAAEVARIRRSLYSFITAVGALICGALTVAAQLVLYLTGLAGWSWVVTLAGFGVGGLLGLGIAVSAIDVRAA